MNIAKSITSINNELLYLVQGEDRHGREAFYYILVDKLKKEIFLKEIATEMSDLRRFGKILISGFGTEPTEDAQLYLKKKFNLDTE